MDEDSRPDDRRSRRWVLATLGTAATLGVAGCSATPSGDATTADDDDPADRTSAAGTTTADGATRARGPSRYTEVYRETIDSVVLVRVYGPTGGGEGSGFMWNENHVVTNQHVVEDSDDIEIRFANNDWRAGELVGADAYSDLAVIRVENVPDYATPLELVESEPPIGTEVVALGNPFGFGGSVSEGIISGVDRSLPGPNDFRIPDAVQTDAAVNPGNSGGPLVTLDGRVVGVINSGGGDNIGFAISAALMERVIPALIEDGDYDHPYMGVRLVGVSPTVAEVNDLEEVTGVMIVEVVDDGPSDGVLQGQEDEQIVDGRRIPVGGDVVVEMDGTEIPTAAALSTFLALEVRPGDTIPVEIVRDGERQTVELTLGERPEV